MAKKTKVGIIGGGISGLTIGYLLKQKGIEIQIFERSHRTGGSIGTKSESGYLVEHGASSFLDNEPKTLELIKNLNLESQVIKTQSEGSDYYIYFKQKLHKIPLNLKDLWETKLISTKTKIKMWLESRFPPHIKANPSSRTIFDFGKDHFGEEFAENLLVPITMGIFNGDAKKLSFSATIPRFQKLEQENKSILKEILGSNKPHSLSFKNGLQTLIDALTKQLSENIVLNTQITKIDLIKNKFIVHHQEEGETDESSDEFQEIIVCVPTTNFSEILHGIVDKNILEKIEKLPTAPVKTISIAFAQPLNFKGFGVLAAPGEDLKILGFFHPKDHFDNRCPLNKGLITVMVGGASQPSAINWSLQNSLKIAIEALTKMLGPLPPIEKYWMWNHAPGQPQYEVGALDTLNQLESKIKSINGLTLNNFMNGGASINDCIRRSFLISEKFNPDNFKIEWVSDQSPEDDEVF